MGGIGESNVKRRGPFWTYLKELCQWRELFRVASRNYGTVITKKACPAMLDNVGCYLFLCPGQSAEWGGGYIPVH
jgi:hypothetical protein